MSQTSSNKQNFNIKIKDNQKKKVYKEKDDYENVDKHPSMGTSAPVSIPLLSKTFQTSSFWGYSNIDSDDDEEKFEKPHELAAKTYNEHFLINMN